MMAAAARRRLQKALAVLFLLAGAGAAGAVEGATVVDTHFLPPDYYVGDTVDLRITLEPEPGFTISSPEELPMVSWIEFSEVEVKQAEEQWRVAVRFTPFAPGTRTLPEISLGDVTLSEIKIHTSSILEEEKAEFYGIKDQLLLPGTRIALGILVVLLFFGPVFAFGFAGRMKRFLSALLSARRGRRPYRRLSRALKELREQQANMSSKRFYILLSDELRRFLTDRTGRDFISITTSELRSQLGGELPEAEQELAERVAEMQRKSDQIKFGGANAAKREREQDIETVLEVSGEIERIKTEAQRRQNSRRAGKKAVKQAKAAKPAWRRQS
jgi:hypothetical protein